MILPVRSRNEPGGPYGEVSNDHSSRDCCFGLRLPGRALRLAPARGADATPEVAVPRRPRRNARGGPRVHETVEIWKTPAGRQAVHLGTASKSTHRSETRRATTSSRPRHGVRTSSAGVNVGADAFEVPSSRSALRLGEQRRACLRRGPLHRHAVRENRAADLAPPGDAAAAGLARTVAVGFSAASAHSQSSEW